MKGDFTRETFNPLKHFSRVLMQQGRVQLDADWNEQISILLHYLQTLTSDLIGPYAGPEGNWGFEIITPDQIPNFDEARQLQPSLTQDEFSQLDTCLKDEGGFLVKPGHYYVNGVLCENEGWVHYYDQPDLKLETSDLDPGTYVVYLDVWERHITYIEDNDIREKALGDVDTTTRTKTVWQVKVKNIKPSYNNCLDGAAVLDNEIALSQACLRPRAKQERRPTEPCLVEPEARYRGTENYLYRIEIHDGSDNKTKNKPSFKWSRVNGSAVFPIKKPTTGQSAIISFKETQITVELAHLGRDNNLGLAIGDWVELLDDNYTLKNEAISLFKIKEIKPSEMKVILENQQPTDHTVDQNSNALLRRWDQNKGVTKRGVVEIKEGSANDWDDEKRWIEIENGIKIQFKECGVYRTGDYWLIPARTALSDVEWPKEIDLKTKFVPPRGVMHHYAPLAIIEVSSDRKVNRVHDCRCSFKPLSYQCSYNYYGQLGIGTDLICPVEP